MRCPSLSMLPPPPPGREGWPWTQECQQLSEIMPSSQSWPKVSIVTPSFNQGNFLEETIRSVLLQGHPNVEYLIIDGGSIDDSIEIIRKYDSWLSYWVSEADRGQAHAINKGFSKCTGKIIGWINSDDMLKPEAIKKLSLAYRQYPDSILIGDVQMVSESIQFDQLMEQKNVTFENMVQSWNLGLRWSQPGTYIPITILDKIGHLDETFVYVFDRDWMCRALQITPVHYIRAPIAKFRMHQDSKTVAEAPDWLSEQIQVTERYWDKIDGLDKSLAMAEMEVWFGALPHLSLLKFQFNRKKGLSHLFKALEYDWQIVFTLQFILLFIIAFTPLRLLRLSRKYVKV